MFSAGRTGRRDCRSVATPPEIGAQRHVSRRPAPAPPTTPISSNGANGSGAQAFDLSADAGNYQCTNANSGKIVRSSPLISPAPTAPRHRCSGWWAATTSASRWWTAAALITKCISATATNAWTSMAGYRSRRQCSNNLRRQPANQKWIFTPSSWGSSSTPTTPPTAADWLGRFGPTNSTVAASTATSGNFEVNGGGGGNNELQYYTDRAQNALCRTASWRSRPIANPLLHRRCRDYTSARSTATAGATGCTAVSKRAPNCRARPGHVAGNLDAADRLGLWQLADEWRDRHHGSGQHRCGRVARCLRLDPLRPGPPNNQHQTAGYYAIQQRCRQLHTYAMEWGPAEIRMYVDGNQYARYSNWWTPNGISGTVQPALPLGIETSPSAAIGRQTRMARDQPRSGWKSTGCEWFRKTITRRNDR